MPQSKITVIVGATPNEERYAYKAARMLTEYGHPIIPFGIKKGEVFGEKIRNEWPHDEAVDTITLYVNPKIQVDLYQDILEMKPKRIIFNPGTENTELAEMARDKGIETLDACTLVLLSTNQY